VLEETPWTVWPSPVSIYLQKNRLCLSWDFDARLPWRSIRDLNIDVNKAKVKGLKVNRGIKIEPFKSHIKPGSCIAI